MLNLKNVKQFFKSVGIGLRYRNTLTIVDVLLHVFAFADRGFENVKNKAKIRGRNAKEEDSWYGCQDTLHDLISSKHGKGAASSSFES